MRVIIIKDDNAVSVDGVKLHVDCSQLPADFHALQWYGSGGELEYSAQFTGEGWTKKMNQIVSDMTPYQPYVDAHAVEKARVDAEVAAQDAADALAASVALAGASANAS